LPYYSVKTIGENVSQEKNKSIHSMDVIH